MPGPRLIGITPLPPVNKTRTFTDPDRPDDPWTLTLRPAKDAPTQLVINEVAQGYIDDFILGRVDPETNLRGPVAPPPRVGETAVPLTKALFRNIAALYVMQVPTEDEPLLTANDLIACSLLYPTAFSEIVVWGVMINTPTPRTGDDVKDAAENP